METEWIKIGEQRLKISDIVRYKPDVYTRMIRDDENGGFKSEIMNYEMIVCYRDGSLVYSEHEPFISKEERDERLKQLDDIFLK